MDEERLKLDEDKKIKEVRSGDKTRHLTWIESSKDIKSIMTPDCRELTPEELFNFVIGNNITDLARLKKTDDNIADIAIVLGNVELPTTRERAIKAFELYRLGFVKRIIFTGGINIKRDKKGIMHPKSFEEYMSNDLVEGIEWQDLPEADWGAETFAKDEFDEDYSKHSSRLTEEFLKSIGVNPEDVLTEAMSTTTQENAEFCKNIFESEDVENGIQVRKAILVTTCTHGNRATRQFKKVFGDRIKLTWCPSTLDLEKHESIKAILSTQNFNEIAFRNELRRIYCTVPELTQMLREEIGHNRNVFIRGEIDEPEITTFDKEVSR